MPENSLQLVGSIKRCLKYFNIILGVALATLGATLTIFSSTLVDKFIDSQLQLKPDSAIFKTWSKPNVNLSLDFYFFNWTNAQDFFNPAVKPKFEQVGPYSYEEVPFKRVLHWHPKHHTVDYEKIHTYYFNKTRTKGSLADEIVSINSLLVGAAVKSRTWSFFNRRVVDMGLTLNGEKITWKQTVEDFLFNGFQSNLVNVLSRVPLIARESIGLYIPFDKLGYMYNRNATSKLIGVQTISTGVSNMGEYGELKLWQGKNKTNKFPKECAAVRGSPGELQKTKLKKFDPIEYFVVDLCRNILLEYYDEYKVDYNLGYRYKMGARVLDNGTLYPENKCYCNGECLPSGAINVSSCLYDLPIFVSSPHFLDADEQYLNDVEGLQPETHLHESTITLHPRTGFILQFKGRMQFNLYLEPSKHLRAYQNKRRMLFPLMWVDAYMELPPDMSFLLYVVNHLCLYCQIFGMSLFLLSSIALLRRPVKKCLFNQYPEHLEIMKEDGDDDEDKEESDKKHSLLCDNNSIIDLYHGSRNHLKYWEL